MSPPLDANNQYLPIPETFRRSSQSVSAVAGRTITSTEGVIGTAQIAIAIAGGLCDTAKPMAELFGIFVPLLKEVVSVADKVLGLYETAEHNKEICRFMVTRVGRAQGAIKPLLTAPRDTAFFNEENYRNVQHLNSIMGEIFTFVKHVTRTRGINTLQKCVMWLNKMGLGCYVRMSFQSLTSFCLYLRFVRFLGARSIEQSLRDLSEELDRALTILNLGITIESAVHRDMQISALTKEISDTEKVRIKQA
jgi:hypothetical protein